MKKALLGTVFTIAFAGAASATPVNGSFTANGFGSYLDNSNHAVTEVNATRLDFGCNSASCGGATGAGNGYGTAGTMSVTTFPATAGSFAGITSLTIQDLQLGGTGSPTTVVPFATPFITFDGGAITFDFTSVMATHNTDTGTAINITGTGNYVSGGTSTPGKFDLSTASAAGDPTSVTFSFTANGSAVSVPEPVSLSLLGAGLIGLGATRLRRRKA